METLPKIQTVDYQQPKAQVDFTQSLLETGFALLHNHPLDQETINTAYKNWFEFFTTDAICKEDFLFDKTTHEGFIPLSLSETAKGSTVKDIKEFYHYYPWGRCPQSLKAITQTLFNQLNSLAKELLQWIENNTPKQVSEKFSLPLSSMITDSPRTLFRILHYPPMIGDETEGAVRAAAHEDINLLTVLPAATASGLQIKSMDGHWQDVPCDPNSLIINVGDMLAECSTNYYQATTHRVINPMGNAAKQSRLSMPLFLHPRDEVRLSKRHTSKSYCDERFRELGLI